MNRVAKRYTKAIFQLALEKNILEQVERDFAFLKKLLVKNSDLPLYLSNPLITDDKKIEMLSKVIGSNINEITYRFLHLMASKRRLRFLPDVLENFRLMMLAHNNTVEAELISAVELEQKQIEAIKDHLQKTLGKNVLMSSKIQPEILGGFVVRVQDVVIDNSIRLQLNKLREKLMTR